MNQVKERTTAYLTVNFYNKEGSLEVPTGVQYRIDCLTSKQVVREWSAVTVAAASVEIMLTAQDNQIRLASNALERRRVTVVASYGGSSADQVSDEVEYEVKNLKGLV